MKPVSFDNANTVLKAPAGHENEVNDLPCFRDGQHVISCWRASLIERLRFLLTGRIWFWCWGTTHPPVLLDTKQPWESDHGRP